MGMHSGFFARSALVLLGVTAFSVLSCGTGTKAARSGTTLSGNTRLAELEGVVFDELSTYRIAYFEAQSVVDAKATDPAAASGQSIQESDEAFRVVDRGPVGDLPPDLKKPSIWVVFSQPVVPLAQLGKPVRDTGLLTIEPKLNGTYRWYGSRLLAFESDDESLPQYRYTVTVSDKFRSLGGKRLEGERVFTFETERLSLVSWELGEARVGSEAGKTETVFEEPVAVDPDDAHPDEARTIRLMFSYPVNLNEIAKWLELRGESRTWAFTLSRPPSKKGAPRNEALVQLRLKETPPFDTEFELVLREGTRSEASMLGTKQEYIYTFHTLRPFGLNSVSTYSWEAPRTPEGDANPIYLEFTHPVDPQGAERLVFVEGLRVEPSNVYVAGKYLILNDLPVEYETTYTVTVAPGLRDVWGRTLGTEAFGEAEIGAASSYASLSDSGAHMLEASFPPKIIWETQNPVSVRRAALSVAGPYERAPEEAMKPVDLSSIPANTRHFRVEDLLPFMGPGGKGSAGFRWEFVTKSSWEEGELDTSEQWLSVQVTDLGITTRYAYNRLLVWATHLSTGSPAALARVELLEGTNLVLDGRTDKDGLAVFDFPQGFMKARFTPPLPWGAKQGLSGLRIRVVEGKGASGPSRTDDEVEFIPNESHNLWRFGVVADEDPSRIEKPRMTTFLFTDRGIYRPGETVSFRGIDRDLQLGAYVPYVGAYKITVSQGAYRSPVVTRLEGTTSITGGNHGSFTLPADAAPGNWLISYERDGQTRRFYFTVANFERLRFETSLSFPDRTLYKGERLAATFSANYLAGGALSSAPYTYYWTREPAYYNPGGFWENWRFGPSVSDGRSYLSEGEGVLGPEGKAELTQESPMEGVEGAPYRFRVEAAAQDAARQEAARRGDVMVHPASFYIGARLDAGDADTEAAISAALSGATSGTTSGTVPNAPLEASSGFLSADKSATVSWALLTPDGKGWVPAKNTELTVDFVRTEWKTARQAGIGGRVNLVWERVELVEDSRKIRVSNPSGSLKFTPVKSGQWQVRLRSADPEKRAVATDLEFYASGSGWVRWGSDDADTISLSADKALYSPGDTAKVLVRSPLPKGRYLVTVEREGIFSQKLIDLDGSARTIDVPIDDTHVPVVYVALSAFTVRTGPPAHTYFEPDLDKPKGLFGLVALAVDPSGLRIEVEIDPLRGSYGPGEEAEVRLEALLDGKPAAGIELSFMAVDRGVVDLIDYRVPDPLSFFYDPSNFPLAVRGADSRSLLMDPVTYAVADLHGGDAAEDPKLKERKDFRPTAVFEPFLVTGADGTVIVRFKLPDSLTTYRCTAVAVDTERFGIAERDLRVSAPITATIATPRKLRWRDTGTVSLILANLERTARDVRVSLKIRAASDEQVPGAGAKAGPVASPVVVDGEAERSVRLEPGQSLELPFRVAAVGTGKVQIEFTVLSESVNERVLKELVVDRPFLFETVATIGNLGGEKNWVEEGLILPSAVGEGTGSLTVSLSASRLALLKESVGYLLDYPYGCLEQRTARLLPLVAFGGHLGAFGLESPVADTVVAVRDELNLIGRNKLNDGSYPYWPGGKYGSYYVSLRVAHIIALAERKGFDIPASIDKGALLSYLAGSDEAQYWMANDPYLRAYALWVRAMNGERVGTELARALNGTDTADSVAVWAFTGLAALDLGMIDLARSSRDKIKKYVRPGTRSLDLGDTSAARTGWWGSDTERYALALMLFHALSPEDDMTTRLSTALLDRQRHGLWGNTNSSYWAVLAFGRVADSEASRGADFRADVRLGGEPFLSSAFRGYGGQPASRSAAFNEAPLAAAARDTLLPLRLERTGPGTLFYTASLKYGLPSELAYARDEGISVYTEVRDSAGMPVEDGKLVAGKTYRARVVVSSSRDRPFLALRSPVPSGAEILDANLITSSRPRVAGNAENAEDGDEGEAYWDAPVRFIMDDELRFHWDLFPAGRQEVAYWFRAVMPGVYPTPPTSAECMYESEVFGRSAGTLFRIAPAAKR